MSSFRDFLVRIAPTWLIQPKGKSWLRAVGGSKDAEVNPLKEAVRARFPTHAPSEGLTHIGVERKLGRARTDTDAVYAARLRNAWALWPWAGTPYGLLGALWDQGYTNAQLVIAKGLVYTMDSSRNLVTTTYAPGAFTFSPATYWSKFLVYFPNPQIARWVSSGVPANGSDEALEFIALVKRWKSAHSYFDRVVIQSSGLTWGLPTTQNWGTGVWGGTQVTWTVPN